MKCPHCGIEDTFYSEVTDIEQEENSNYLKRWVYHRCCICEKVFETVERWKLEREWYINEEFKRTH